MCTRVIHKVALLGHHCSQYSCFKTQYMLHRPSQRNITHRYVTDLLEYVRTRWGPHSGTIFNDQLCTRQRMSSTGPIHAQGVELPSGSDNCEYALHIRVERICPWMGMPWLLSGHHYGPFGTVFGETSIHVRSMLTKIIDFLGPGTSGLHIVQQTPA